LQFTSDITRNIHFLSGARRQNAVSRGVVDGECWLPKSTEWAVFTSKRKGCAASKRSLGGDLHSKGPESLRCNHHANHPNCDEAPCSRRSYPNLDGHFPIRTRQGSVWSCDAPSSSLGSIPNRWLSDYASSNASHSTTSTMMLYGFQAIRPMTDQYSSRHRHASAGMTFSRDKASCIRPARGVR